MFCCIVVVVLIIIAAIRVVPSWVSEGYRAGRSRMIRDVRGMMGRIRRGTLPGVKGVQNRPLVRLHTIPTCPYCRTIKPTWAQLSESMGGVADFIELVDIPRTPWITAYPTISMVVPSYDGLRTVKYQGVMQYEDIRRWIAGNI